MADTNLTPPVTEARESTQGTLETRLSLLTDRLIKNGKMAVTAALFGLASAVSGSAYAADTPNTPSTSANASADKGGGQVVLLKDGRKVNFADIAKLEGVEKDAIIDGMSRSEKIKFKEWDVEAANQRINGKKEVLNQVSKSVDEKKEALNQESIIVDEKKMALNQINALYDLIDILFTEQGIKPDEKYKSHAIIVQNVLSNPINVQKLAPDTINFLNAMEKSLSEGKNPFAHMSSSGKAKLKALFK